MDNNSQSEKTATLQELFEAYVDGGVQSQFASYTLVKEFGISALAPLLKNLEEQNVNVRCWSAISIGLLNDKSSIEPLIQCLEEGNVIIRKEAVRLLGGFNESRVVEPLIKRLKDQRKTVRKAAVKALSGLRSKNVIDALRWLEQNEMTSFLDGDEEILSEIRKSIQNNEQIP